MIEKRFMVDEYYAHTLSAEYIGCNESGWCISGEIKEDHYLWVNEFDAKHPIYGRLCCDFEKIVYVATES